MERGEEVKVKERKEEEELEEDEKKKKRNRKHENTKDRRRKHFTNTKRMPVLVIPSACQTFRRPAVQTKTFSGRERTDDIFFSPVAMK